MDAIFDVKKNSEICVKLGMCRLGELRP